MKTLLLFLKIFNRIRPLLRDVIIPAIQAINIIKQACRQNMTGEEITWRIEQFFEHRREATVAITAMWNVIRNIAPDSSCLKQATPADAIACFLREIQDRPKHQQRMVWREFARALIKYRAPERLWDDAELDTALQMGYSMSKMKNDE